LGIFTGTFAEAVLVDWSAVFARDALNLEISLRSTPFAAFMVGMIIGRLSMSSLSKKFHPSELAQYGAFGGAALLLGNAFVSPMLAQNSASLGLIINAAAFFLAGLSMSAIAPSFFAAAGHVPNVNTASALATISLFNAVVSIGAKTFVGAIAEGIGVEAVFVFPALLLVIAGFIAGKVAKSAKSSELDTAYPPTGPLSVISD
jgi:fucose permease